MKVKQQRKGGYDAPATADLLLLIEDELSLLMPLSLKHDACEHKYQPAVEETRSKKNGITRLMFWQV